MQQLLLSSYRHVLPPATFESCMCYHPQQWNRPTPPARTGRVPGVHLSAWYHLSVWSGLFWILIVPSTCVVSVCVVHFLSVVAVRVFVCELQETHAQMHDLCTQGALLVASCCSVE